VDWLYLAQDRGQWQPLNEISGSIKGREIPDQLNDY